MRATSVLHAKILCPAIKVPGNGRTVMRGLRHHRSHTSSPANISHGWSCGLDI